MTDYDTTWWQATGEMTPFDNGVSSPIYRNISTGILRSSRDLPIGALYVISRPPGCSPNDHPRTGHDGLAIARKLSDHTWYIEGRASNCTRKDDDNHRCWVRKGTFGERLTVGKDGDTCAAGSGSFFMGEDNAWHGFLDDGFLKQR